ESLILLCQVYVGLCMMPVPGGPVSRRRYSMELRDALLKVIHEEFGGSRKDFALAVDEEQTTVSRWITGKVALPKAGARRKIAKVLGVRHVDILVMAGELLPSEVASVAPACERSEADRIMERLDPESREVAL